MFLCNSDGSVTNVALKPNYFTSCASPELNRGKIAALTSGAIGSQSVIVFPFVPCDPAHGDQSSASQRPLWPTGALISSPGPIVGRTNHKQRRHSIDGNVCVYGVWNRTEAGVWFLCHRSLAARSHYSLQPKRQLVRRWPLIPTH